VRQYLGPAIETITGPLRRDVRTDYLDGISRQVEDNFIGPIDAVLRQAPQVHDVRALIKFANAVLPVCSSITAIGPNLFAYSLSAQVLIRNTNTGEVVVGPPQELTAIMLPFKLILEQLVRVADAIDGSLKHWTGQLDAAKRPFLEYVTANTSHQANRLTVLVQVLTITIAVVLSALFFTLTDPLALEKSNLALKRQLDINQAAVASEHTANQSLRSENDALRADVARLRAQVDRDAEQIEDLRKKPGHR